MSTRKRPFPTQGKRKASAPKLTRSRASQPIAPSQPAQPASPAPSVQPHHAIDSTSAIDLSLLSPIGRLPVELLSEIFQEVVLSAELCDLRYKTHEVVLPPIDSQHQKLIADVKAVRKNRAVLMLVCRFWTQIMRDRYHLYRDIVITSFRQNYLLNAHFDEDLRGKDNAAYCRRINNVRRIDVAYSIGAHAPWSLPPSVGSRSRRSHRLRAAGGRAENIDQRLSETNQVTQVMLVCNRFSKSPLPIDDQPYPIPPAPTPLSPSNPLSKLLQLNITSEISLPLVFQVISGCEQLERLGLFNLSYPRTSVMASDKTATYMPMKSLKTWQLKMNWRGALNGATYSSPFTAMVDGGFALPNLSRLRIHRSDSGIPVPINLIHLMSSHSPIEQLDIEGGLGSMLRASEAGKPWGGSIKQLEISIAEREDLQALGSFNHLSSLETLVLNGFTDIIALPSADSPPDTKDQEIAAKMARLNTIFDKAKEFCQRHFIHNLVISDLGDSEDTYGPLWSLIEHHASDLKIKDIRFWARRDRSFIPICAVDYIDNGRGEHVMGQWRQDNYPQASLPPVSTL